MDTIKQKPARQITLKQKRFAAAYVETGNKAEAARRAGYVLGSKGGSKTKEKEQFTASMIGQENFQKPIIKKEIDMLIGRFSDSMLSGKIEELLEGKKTVLYRGENREITDNQAKIAALDIVFKLKGSYAPEKKINVNVYNDLTDTDLINELKKLNEKLTVTSPQDE